MNNCGNSMVEFSDSKPSLEELEAAKVTARRSLLAQEPEVAQAIVNQTLHPHLWSVTEDEAWEERLPREVRTFEEAIEEKPKAP
jgi:hypothetical protein